LGPEFEKLALEFEQVSIGLDIFCCFELDPIYGLFLVFRLTVPDYAASQYTVNPGLIVNIPASTSPPITRLAFPNPVLTTEQY
jgi:hypothetical protein